MVISGKGKKSSKNKKSTKSTGFESQIGSFFEGMVDLSSTAIKYAAGTTEVVSNTFRKTPERLELMGKAGIALKDMRETAGLSIEDLSSIIDLDNPDLMKAIEEGKTALPMDVMMRLASYYSRNDPLPFIMRFSRTYHPTLSQLLSKTGIDRLLLKAERELKFLKIYRNVDAARDLSDEGFDKVLEFTRKAFNMALHFVAEQENLKMSEEDMETVTEGSSKDKEQSESAKEKKEDESNSKAGDEASGGKESTKQASREKSAPKAAAKRRTTKSSAAKTKAKPRPKAKSASRSKPAS